MIFSFKAMPSGSVGSGLPAMRQMKVTISARVQSSVGSKCVSSVPVMILFSSPQ